MNTILATRFAPAGHATAEDIKRQHRSVADMGILARSVLDAVPDFLAILNKERQIIFANRSLLEFLGVDLKTSLGLRPGEALGCVNSFEEGGCGTAEACCACGAVTAILTCQKGHPSVRECRITRKTGDVLDLRVWATPIKVDGEEFVIFAAVDTSHEKRRHVLECIFFHDVLNVATGLIGATRLLGEKDMGRRDELTTIIQHLTETLVEEINVQRELTDAENNELSVHPERVDARELIREIADSYIHHEAAKERQIKVDDTECVGNGREIVIDRMLLKRVIGNMVKNALEACHPGEVVTVGSRVSGGLVRFWVHNPNQMPRKSQFQIFQRSFSTKGEGRGLGTYSMKLLSERYLNGSVTFTSSEAGTVFEASYPFI